MEGRIRFQTDTKKKESYQATFLIRSTQCFLTARSKLFFLCRVIQEKNMTQLPRLIMLQY